MADPVNVVFDSGLNRKVLVALELIDPIALAVVRDGVAVTAQGLIGKPIVNLSGRFVWLAEGNSWPTVFTVDSTDGRFASQVIAAPAKPADLENATGAQRLARAALRPSPAYDFEDGVTVVRGRLVKDGQQNSPPVVGAKVQLAWYDADAQTWSPAPPAAPNAARNSGIAPSPAEVQTDAGGEFAAFLRLTPPTGSNADIQNGLLTVRLQFTVAGNPAATYITPPNYSFMTGGQAPAPPAGDAPAAPPTGRVPEGQVLGFELPLNLTILTQLN